MPTEKPLGHLANCPGRLMLRATAHGIYYLSCTYCYSLLVINIDEEQQQSDFIGNHISPKRS